MEKAKCKAAIEAAEIAQRMAEKEALRRKQAETMARREAEEKNRALNALSKNEFRYRRYTIEEIEVGTEKFAESMKIGEGGYGPVYKGFLDHTPVAIKILRPDISQGLVQFQQEVTKNKTKKKKQGCAWSILDSTKCIFDCRLRF